MRLDPRPDGHFSTDGGCRLQEAGALHEVQPKTDIYCLNERYYSRDFGLSTEPVSPGELLYVD